MIQYQIIYYFLGVSAILDDLENRAHDKIGNSSFNIAIAY